MKVIIGQISATNDDFIKLVSLVFLIGNFFFASIDAVFPQPPSKENDRTTSFGNSLKKYEKKNDSSKNKAPSKVEIKEEIIRVETNLVVNDILVVNQNGNVILGLKKDDFIVTEDDAAQEIGVFVFGRNTKIPRSIVLIVENGGVPSFIEQSIEAAKKFVDKLEPQDKMAIASDNLKLLCDFTNDKISLKSTLESLKKRPGASRREFSTLLAVLNEMFDADNIRPIVILQASGDESVFLKPIWESHKKYCLKGVTDFCEKNFSFNDVKEIVEKSRATIYGVIPKPRVIGLTKEVQLAKTRILLTGIRKEIHNQKEEKNIANFIKEWEEFTLKESVACQTSVFEIANLSGGYTDFLEKPEDAETVYSTIFQTIENRYVIGYYPKNETRDGKRRNVKIEVKNHPEYIIVGRKSYFAPIENK